MMRRLSSIACREGIRLLPMPKLSPSMIGGKVEKWRINRGDMTKPYQLILEISTETLLKIGLQRDIMDIEIIEDSYLAKILVSEGESVKVGSPIAIFCEDKNDLDFASKLQIPGDVDVYDSPLGIPMALWQAYKKD